MKKQVICCSSRDEMKKIADRMVGQGYIVRTVESMTVFSLYGLCMPQYKVIIQDGLMDGKRVKGPGFLNRIWGRTTWILDWHKTSVLSENSAL